MADKNYRLRVEKGPQEGQSYALVGTMVTVGRDPMADIVITDPEVSRQHARFTRSNEGYEVQDLGSTNGTFIDGRRLGGDAHPLTPGQVITMGSNVYLVYEEVGDQMATVIAAGGEDFYPEEEEAEEADARPGVQVFDFPEAEGEEDDYGTVLEEPAAEPVETAPMAYEEVEEEDAATTFDFPSFEEEEEAFGSFEEEEDFASFDEEEEDFDSFDESGDLPSFDQEEELPEFGQAAPPPYGKTILEPEAAGPEGEKEDLPAFGGAGEEIYEPKRDVTVPPAPDAPGAPPPRSNRNRNIIIAVLAVLFLCCCCVLLAYIGYAYVGDALLCGVVENYPGCP